MTTQALGISVGDIVRTSYGTGPYEVIGLSTPCFYYQSSVSVIAFWDHPVMSMTMVDPGVTRRKECDYRYINGIWREGDRWFTQVGATPDEIFVSPAGATLPAPGLSQLDMFASPPPTATAEPLPWLTQDGVDYVAGDGRLWTCVYCPCDFNTAEKQRRPVRCPNCGGIAWALLNMATGSPNVYLRGLGA